MSARAATAQLHRLVVWLELFKVCFGRRAHVLAVRRYVQGLLSDSDRKSMQAMLARVTEPGSYQAFQHFITHSPWSADRVWRRLRAVLPDRTGVLIVDSTAFLKQGHQSVGVARQYFGLQGQIVNCQKLVTAALWTGTRTYLVGAALYLPEEWLTDAARTRARIPATVTFQQRWRLVLTLLRQIRASGIALEGVLADAEFGDNRMFRQLLHRCRLPYAVGVSSHLTAFVGTPHTDMAGRRTHPRVLGRARPIADVLATTDGRWRSIRWRNRPGGATHAVEARAIRVTPAVDSRHPRLAPEIWLLAERAHGARRQTRFFFVNLPATAPLAAIVRLAHQRWAIEQPYQELKTELGLDHFEGRTFPGWHHHVVLTAIAYNFLQAERQRRGRTLSFPSVRGIVQEIFTAYLFAQRPHYLRRIAALRSVQMRI